MLSRPVVVALLLLVCLLAAAATGYLYSLAKGKEVFEENKNTPTRQRKLKRVDYSTMKLIPLEVIEQDRKRFPVKEYVPSWQQTGTTNGKQE